MSENLKILIYGAGAVGSSIGGWIYPEFSETLYLKTRGEHETALKKKGLYLYMKRKKEDGENYSVNVIEGLSEIRDVDMIFLSVKNYDLDDASKDISSKLGTDKIIIGLQNGVKNQEILPKYFNKIIYGVICFNACIDEPGVVGYKERGPIIIGSIDENNNSELQRVADVLNSGVKTEISNNIQDAIHSKAVINSLNALYTLVGLRYRKIEDYRLLGKITRELLYEGMEIVQEEGYNEHKLGNLANWRTVRLAQKLPSFLSTWLYKRKLKAYVLSSTASDILIKKKDKN
ncbi:MAG: hypothetical protein GF329_13215 [Candidatus Lokiarchaeota archaeon]|nr:hypothetical protein [Candidatus Lokiarchaeota archaeon]